MPDPEPLRFDTARPDAPTMADVRRWAARVLPGLDEDHLSDVLLVTTELVSNVVDHAPGPAHVRVFHRPDPCRVHVEVDDTSDLPPVLGRSSIADTRGRGVAMVAVYSEDWGVRRRAEGGKTVWAVLACDSSTCGPTGR
ncbi:histidine kinase-like protein [Saccharothrix carnea]|uniref:Histidine kinase-like protein n=1 Tax=Saccharothrix carnea TaxID=1280637 RepID=A0A2P8HBR8_SACCR|nr:ATP-binding protein [Saccharothrix carnea]PSL43664.1 histidine kinase-like protein [Saccharothrix carnea]